jgi:hypothetical protein
MWPKSKIQNWHITSFFLPWRRPQSLMWHVANAMRIVYRLGISLERFPTSHNGSVWSVGPLGSHCGMYGEYCAKVALAGSRCSRAWSSGCMPLPINTAGRLGWDWWEHGSEEDLGSNTIWNNFKYCICAWLSLPVAMGTNTNVSKVQTPPTWHSRQTKANAQSIWKISNCILTQAFSAEVWGQDEGNVS